MSAGIATKRAFVALLAAFALVASGQTKIDLGTQVRGTLPAANGGAGAISGALKANGSGVVSAASCADLANGATGCATPVGTAGATLPLNSGNNTFSGSVTFSSPVAATVTFATSAGTAASAATASTATFATTAANATTATFATSAANATTATFATSAASATSAGTATFATSAANATTATFATSAGTASSATTAGNASTVTTNANLTGPITSSGNATSIAAQTGTGSTFVMASSPTLNTPTLVAPALGTPLSGVATNLTGTAASLSVGTATFATTASSATTAAATASQSGTGSTYVTNSSPTLNTPTLVAPALGTPLSGVVTNLTGTAASVTVGTATRVITNANLTGPITSTGNATAIAAQTGTGSTFVMQSTPTLNTPTLVAPALGTPLSGTLTNASGLPISSGVSGLGTGVATALGVNVGSVGSAVVNGGALGTPASGVATNLTGTASGLTVGTATFALTSGGATSVNLTGPITSVGSATSVAAQTGTGSTFVMDSSPTINTPTLVAPALGTPLSGTLTNATGLPVGTGVSGLGTGIATALGVNVGTAGSPVINGGALGTPLSGVATNLTGTASSLTAGTATNVINAKRLVANVTLGSGATSLASGTFAAFRFLEVHVFIPGYAGSDTASLQFNATGGTAYRYRWLTSAAGGTTFAAGLVAASTDRVKIAAANTTNSRRVVAHISNDATITEKLVKFESQFGTASAGTQDTLDIGQGAWISGATTQITSISLLSSSNMNAGTQLVVFGWN